MLFCPFFHFFTIFLKIWSKITNIICIFAVSSGEKSRTDDALLIDTHLTEGVWKTQFGIVRSLSRGGQKMVS